MINIRRSDLLGNCAIWDISLPVTQVKALNYLLNDPQDFTLGILDLATVSESEFQKEYCLSEVCLGHHLPHFNLPAYRET